MASYIDLGKKIYNMNNPREVRRMAVFVVRSLMHNSEMQDLERFFYSSAVLKQLIEESPFPMEQITRAFFYKGSTFKERIRIAKEHFEFCQRNISEDALLAINSNTRPGIVIWENDFEGIGTLRAVMVMEPGQRKEGFTSVELNLYQEGKYIDHLYQIMYWIAKDKDNYDSLYIGAMQGPNMDDSKDLIKKFTKACHGYRTKNLILYIVQAMTRNLGIKRIYAVTNEGYYANNHARIDRKLKTSFSDFWAEAGGVATTDDRFYTLPLKETRKTMEEVPTRKRAVYRRRFALLDDIDKSISDNIKEILIV